MKERGFRAYAHEVRAILAGTKTQTRRVVKPQPDASTVALYNGDIVAHHFVNEESGSETGYGFESHTRTWRCPYGQPGDRLWVRERHCYLDVVKSGMSGFPLGPENGNRKGPTIWNVTVEYADGVEIESSVEGKKPRQTRERGEIRWRPSIHMPRWASRITLEITGVRVDRLQSIDDHGAIAEGAEQVGDINGAFVAGFKHLWESLNGPGSWSANPWVWVIEFRRLP